MYFVNWFIREIYIRLWYFCFFSLYSLGLLFHFKGVLLIFFINLYLKSFSGKALVLLNAVDLIKSQILVCGGVWIFFILLLFFCSSVHYFLPGLYNYEVNKLCVYFSTLLVSLFFIFYYFILFVGELYYCICFMFLPNGLSLEALSVNFTLVDFIKFSIVFCYAVFFLVNLAFILFYLCYSLVNQPWGLRNFRFFLFVLCFVFILFILPPDPLLHISFFIIYSIWWELFLFFSISVYYYGKS